MIEMSSLHSLMAELHSGMLFLAFLCIIITAGSQLVVGFSKKKGIFYRIATKIRGYTEATGIVAAIGGFVIILIASYTGMYAWGNIENVLISPEVRNKITLTAFAIAHWGLVIFIRLRFGRGIWTCPPMAVVYTAAATLAFAFTALSGSLGAHFTAGESLIDPLWDMLKIDITTDIILSTTAAIALAVASVIILVVIIAIGKKKGLFVKRLTRPKYETRFKWDEPVIDIVDRKEEPPAESESETK